MASRPRGSARPRVTRVFVRLAVVVGLAGILLLAGSGAAEAHPLGNFTINLYDGLIVRTDGIDVDYVVDMAEIPAFEERQTIDVNGDGTLDPTETAAYVDQTCGRLADGLTVAVAGSALPVRPAGDGTVSFPPGAGGLSTMRLECPMHGKAQLREGQQIAYRDGNFAGRIGWHEVTVVGDRLAVLASDAPAQSLSARLTSYPANLLQSPLDQRTASFQVGGPTSISAAPVSAASAPITRGFGDMLTTAFAGLVTTGGSTPLLWALALATAFAIGGLHALGPGHGKTLMAAYLVGIGRPAASGGRRWRRSVGDAHGFGGVAGGHRIARRQGVHPRGRVPMDDHRVGRTGRRARSVSPHHATPRRPPRTRARAWARP